MAALSDLIAQREALDKAIADAKEQSRAEGLAKVKSVLEEYDLTVKDVVTKFGFSAKASASALTSAIPKAKVAAKFIDKTTGAQWSGRGLKPKWLKTAIDAGAKLEDFAV
ncbi:MAG: H-NS histone family protein [Paucibacter sp.]|nr:H-NS histone family protein [Roseateles sp.]